jgi:hypothetical protein
VLAGAIEPPDGLAEPPELASALAPRSAVDTVPAIRASSVVAFLPSIRIVFAAYGVS